jgi:phage-related protein (TIGR01555 family)
MTPQERKERSAKANAAKQAKAEAKKRGISYMVLENAKVSNKQAPALFQPPRLFPGVVPQGVTPAVAMDSQSYSYANDVLAYSDFHPFVGYQILAGYATRPEYRAMASVLASEMTRKFISLKGKDDKDDLIKEKISEIEEEFHKLNVKGVLQTACEHDALYGRGQIFITLKGQEKDKPMILDPRTIPLNSLERFSAVEPMWVTPVQYNAIDPTAPDFYRPTAWFMMGQKVHASRLAMVTTRPLPDMLKPAYNFSGISLSQLAQPYVENWLRTRQSVSDMINIYSITALQTDMSAVLQGGDSGDQLLKRAELFTQMRSNKGLMVLDKELEELVQINTPLSGLDALQAQSLEQLCVVSRIPAVILTGLSPSGLNASSEGELKSFWAWINAMQEAHLRGPLETILKVVQLSLFGEIDPSVTFEFNPMEQMNDKELAEIRRANADEAAILIDRGVIDAAEAREKFARDANSGWHGLDLSKEIEMPEPEASPFGDNQDGFDPTGEVKDPETEPKEKGAGPDTEPKIGE